MCWWHHFMKGRKVFILDDGNLPPRGLMSCSKKIYSEQHCETSVLKYAFHFREWKAYFSAHKWKWILVNGKYREKGHLLSLETTWDKGSKGYCSNHKSKRTVNMYTTCHEAAASFGVFGVAVFGVFTYRLDNYLSWFWVVSTYSISK